MTLEEMAREYRAAAEPIRRRLQTVRRALRQAQDTDEVLRLQYRQLRLQQMLTQTGEVANLLEHYYEKGFYRNEKYSL